MLLEIFQHRNGLAIVTMLKLAALGSHIPADGVKLVGLKESVPGHDDVTVELVIYSLLGSFIV